MGEREKTKGIGGPSKDPSLPFFLRLPCLTWQTMSEVACLLIFVGHALAPFSKWVRPILRGGRCGVPESRAVTPRGVIGEVTIRPPL